MNNSALPVGATAAFLLNNSLITVNDTVIINGSNVTAIDPFNYSFEAYGVYAGSVGIIIKNTSLVSRSEAVVINFSVIKGATA